MKQLLAVSSETRPSNYRNPWLFDVPAPALGSHHAPRISSPALHFATHLSFLLAGATFHLYIIYAPFAVLAVLKPAYNCGQLFNTTPQARARTSCRAFSWRRILWRCLQNTRVANLATFSKSPHHWDANVFVMLMLGGWPPFTSA